jgi:hypothetical protein
VDLGYINLKFDFNFDDLSKVINIKNFQGAKTGFGGKNSWFQKVFGNHLIKP